MSKILTEETAIMPPPFHELTREKFAHTVDKFRWRVSKSRVDMHHTWKPDHSSYKGLRSVEGMWRFHTEKQGWSDIAQHVSIGPDGSIWTGRDWNRSPASAAGHNHSGVFMFETIGNFDLNKDTLTGEQLKSVLYVIGTIQEYFNLSIWSVKFHNQFTNNKTCPGTSVTRTAIVRQVQELRRSLADDLINQAEVLERAEPSEIEAVSSIAQSIEDSRVSLPEDVGEHSHDEEYAAAIARYLE